MEYKNPIFNLLWLKDKLSYDPDSGVWTWLVNPGHGLSPGDRAGSARPDGYRTISVCKNVVKEHRLAFFYMTGKWPERVDHRDGDPSNNRWSNLREASHSQNMTNARKHSNNTAGYKGVSFRADQNKWRAYIQIDGRKSYLGSFNCPTTAGLAYLRAAKRHYGEFARAA